MPLLEYDPANPLIGFGQRPNLPAPEKPEAPGILETVGASFVAENSLVNYGKRTLNQIRNAFPEQDETPLSARDIYNEISGTQYEPFYSELASSPNQATLQGYKKIIDDRLSARDILNNSGMGASIVGGLVAGALDISTLFPGGIAYKSYKAGNAALKSALSVGTAGALSTAATEVALHNVQSERTYEESIYNTIGGAIFSGAIGGGVGYLTSKSHIKAVDEIANVLSGNNNYINIQENGTVDIKTISSNGKQAPLPEPIADLNINFNSGDGGAARSVPDRLEEFLPANFRQLNVDEGLANVPNWLQKVLVYSPITRGLTSDFGIMRKFTNDIYQHDLVLGKNVNGQSSPAAIETLITLSKVDLYKSHVSMENSYAKYIGVKEGAFQELRAKINRGDKLTREQFGERVSKAMRRDDSSDIPEVIEAAKHYRAVIDKFKDEAVQLQLLPENVSVETAASYLTRSYNRNKIISSRPEFDAIVRKWLTEQNEQLISLYPQISTLENNISAAEKLLDFEKNKKNKGIITDSKIDAQAVLDAESGLVIASKRYTAKVKSNQTFKTRSNGRLKSIKESIDKKNKLISDKSKGKMTDAKKQQIAEAKRIIGNYNQSILKIEGDLKSNADQIPELKNNVDILRKQRDEETISDLDEETKQNKKLIQAIRENKNVRGIARAKEILADFNNQLDQFVPKSLRHADGTVRTPMSTFEIGPAARKIIDNIIGDGDDKLTNPLFSRINGNKGVDTLKQRAFLIPDELIEDFLDNNINRVMDNYVSGLAPRLEMEKFFVKTGYKELGGEEGGIGGMKKAIKAEYEQIRMNIDDKGKAAQNKRKKLEKEYQRSLQWIDDSFSVLQGTYGIPKAELGRNAARTMRVARNYNLIRLLGGVTLASIPDAAMPIYRHGFNAYVRDGIMPVLKSMKDSKLSKDQWKDIGVGLETVSSRRFMELASGPEAFFEQNALERGVDRMAKNFGNITLANQWTDMMSRMSTQISSARIIRAINKFESTGKISKKDLSHLSRIGIDQKYYSRIQQQFSKFGDEVNGSFIANINDWDDLVVRDVFNAAMLTDVNSTVIQPGLGDKPFFTRTGWGAALTQFKSFGFAATNKILLAGLQRRDAHVLQGMISMLGLGAMTYYAQRFAANDEVSDDPTKIFLEAMDKSGLAGLLFEPLFVADKAFGLSEEGFSRYRSRGPWGAMLGPSAGLIEDLTSVSGSAIRSLVGDDEFTRGNLHTARRALPYQNLFYTRRLVEQGTDKIADELGLPGRRK